MTAPIDTDFDEWLAATHGELGDFTMLFVLMRITETTVEPLRGAWLHVVGDETRWPDMTALFAGAGSRPAKPEHVTAPPQVGPRPAPAPLPAPAVRAPAAARPNRRRRSDELSPV